MLSQKDGCITLSKIYIYIFNTLKSSRLTSLSIVDVGGSNTIHIPQKTVTQLFRM